MVGRDLYMGLETLTEEISSAFKERDEVKATRGGLYSYGPTLTTEYGATAQCGV